MSKMELDKRLEENKYEMYEALKMYIDHQEGTRGHYCSTCHTEIEKVIAEIEGKDG